MACMAVSGMDSNTHLIRFSCLLFIGIGPKVTQSVLTAAFLFAFKDVLYDMTVKARKNLTKKA